jgi:hypothetical protein
MMGWTEIVYSSASASALAALVEAMARGVRAEEALEEVRAAGLDRSVNRYGLTAVYKRFAPAGGDERLIEVPTILDDTGEALADGTNLSSSLDGKAGDGEPDVLTLTTKLAGVVEGTEGEYGVRYELGGQEIGTGYGLTTATRLDEYTVTVEYEITLGRDAPTEETELEAIVDLPEGGESRYSANVNFKGDCGWTMSFSGPDHSGNYDGDLASVLRGPPTTIFLGDTGPTASPPSVTIQFPKRLPTDVPTTLALGLSGSANPDNQDGALEIGFEDALYRSGDGSPCCTPTDPQDTFPAPLTMTLEVNSSDRVEGTISGQVWAYAPGGTLPLRKASVQIDFSVTTDSGCQISDPYNP